MHLPFFSSSPAELERASGFWEHTPFTILKLGALASRLGAAVAGALRDCFVGVQAAVPPVWLALLHTVDRQLSKGARLAAEARAATDVVICAPDVRGPAFESNSTNAIDFVPRSFS